MSRKKIPIISKNRSAQKAVTSVVNPHLARPNQKKDRVLLICMRDPKAVDSLFSAKFASLPLGIEWMNLDRLTGGLISRARAGGLFFQKDPSRITLLSGNFPFRRVYLWVASQVFPFSLVESTEGRVGQSQTQFCYFEEGFKPEEIQKGEKIFGNLVVTPQNMFSESHFWAADLGQNVEK